MFIIFIDIDECVEDLCVCDVYVYCVNILGFYNCLCKLGYNYNGSVCLGIMLYLKVLSLLF